jgi:hypothetical protein
VREGDGLLHAVCGRPEPHALSNAAKIRQLFVIPNAAEREFFGSAH